MTTEQTQATLTAIIGQKLGMTQVFDENAQARPVTVIKAGPVRVVQIKTPEKDGYSAVQIAFGEVKPNRVNKPLQGHYAKAGVTPGRVLLEVRVPDASAFEVGQEFTVADVFQPGQKADVTGTSKGKGFAGVMKRHNSPARALPTATTRSAPPDRSAPAPRPPGCSRACAWPAAWATTGSRPQPRRGRSRRRARAAAAPVVPFPEPRAPT